MVDRISNLLMRVTLEVAREILGDKALKVLLDKSGLTGKYDVEKIPEKR